MQSVTRQRSLRMPNTEQSGTKKRVFTEMYSIRSSAQSAHPTENHRKALAGPINVRVNYPEKSMHDDPAERLLELTN